MMVEAKLDSGRFRWSDVVGSVGIRERFLAARAGWMRVVDVWSGAIAGGGGDMGMAGFVGCGAGRIGVDDCGSGSLGGC